MLYSNETEAKKFWDLYLRDVDSPNFFQLWERAYWRLDAQTPPAVLEVRPLRKLQVVPIDYQSPLRHGQDKKS